MVALGVTICAKQPIPIPINGDGTDSLAGYQVVFTPKDCDPAESSIKPIRLATVCPLAVIVFGSTPQLAVGLRTLIWGEVAVRLSVVLPSGAVMVTAQVTVRFS